MYTTFRSVVWRGSSQDISASVDVVVVVLRDKRGGGERVMCNVSLV